MKYLIILFTGLVFLNSSAVHAKAEPPSDDDKKCIRIDCPAGQVLQAFVCGNKVVYECVKP